MVLVIVRLLSLVWKNSNSEKNIPMTDADDSDDDNDLDKPRLRVELYLPPVLEPVDIEVEVGVRHGVAAEGGRVARLHLVRLRALVMVKYFY